MREIKLSLLFLLCILPSLIQSSSLPSSNWSNFKKTIHSIFSEPSEPKNSLTIIPTIPPHINNHKNNNNNNESIIDKETLRQLFFTLTSRVLSALISVLIFKFMLKQFTTTFEATTGKFLFDRDGSENNHHHHNMSLKFPEYINYLKTNITLNLYEQELLSSSIQLPHRISSDWNSLGGLQTIKKSLWQIALTQKRSFSLSSSSSPNSPLTGEQKGQSFRLFKPVKSLLFYGPPGCGKSAIVHGLAKRLGWPIMTITPSGLLRKYVGETSLLTKAIFTLAKKFQHCIIFIDEMDSLFRARNDIEHQVDRNLMTEFMQLWDDIITDQQVHQVLIVGATNRPQDLDPAIQRRFERSFLIGIPNQQERVAILKKLLHSIEKEKGFDFGTAAKLTEGYCSNDLLNLCKAAIVIPLTEKKRLQQQQQHRGTTLPPEHAAHASLRPLKIEDIQEAIHTVPPSSWTCKAYGSSTSQPDNTASVNGFYPYTVDPNTNYPYYSNFPSQPPSEENNEAEEDDHDTEDDQD